MSQAIINISAQISSEKSQQMTEIPQGKDI